MGPEKRTGPAGNGAGNREKDQTERQSTRAAGHLARWHEQCEYEGAVRYANGWTDGYAAGQRALVDEIARTVGIRPYSVKSVIEWLCRDIDNAVRDRRAEPYTSPANGTAVGGAEREAFGELGRAA